MSLPEIGLLGLFGGTFDPLHNAHLQLALEARVCLSLAEVRFIPAGNPPLRDAPRTAAIHRLAMVERAIAGIAGFSVNASEAKQPGPSYTFDTLERLRKEMGNQRPVVLLLGADAFSRLAAWHRWRDLFELTHLAVATRPAAGGVVESGLACDWLQEFQSRLGTPHDLQRVPAGCIVPFAIPSLDISATVIRDRLARGLSVSHLVPKPVLDYIEAQNLYRTPHEH